MLETTGNHRKRVLLRIWQALRADGSKDEPHFRTWCNNNLISSIYYQNVIKYRTYLWHIVEIYPYPVYFWCGKRCLLILFGGMSIAWGCKENGLSGGLLEYFPSDLVKTGLMLRAACVCYTPLGYMWCNILYWYLFPLFPAVMYKQVMMYIHDCVCVYMLVIIAMKLVIASVWVVLIVCVCGAGFA